MKKLLVVVDYQNDFVSGALGFEKAVKLEDNIVNKINEYKANNDDIVYTFDTHSENYLSTQEGKNLPIKHCVKGTEGWQLYGKVNELCDEKAVKIEKPAFGSIKLAEYVAKNNYDEIELVGVVSNICVISNAVIVKAALPEAKVIVDAACTASNDDDLNEKCLDVMAGLQIEIKNR